MSQELSARIRQFLLKNPRPDIVRVTTASGETKEVHIDDKVRWSNVANTVVSLNPAVVTALNNDDAVLRVEKIVNEDVPSVDTGDDPTTTKMPLHSDPVTAQLHHFGTLLAHAYKFATEVAFEKLAERDERDMRRQEATEKRLERMEAAYRSEFEGRVRERLDGMEEGDGKDKLIEAFFSGRMGAAKDGAQQSRRPTNGKSSHSVDWGGESN